MASANRSAFATLLMVVFFSYAGFSISFPILTPLFVQEGAIFALGPHRTLLLGATFFLYALGQFAGSILLGALSDAIGRKRALLVAVTGTMAGYMLSAFAISSANLWLFLYGRALTGFFEASTAIGQAYAADLCAPKKRLRYFSLLSTAASLGWLVGPIMGSLLASAPVLGMTPYASVFFWSGVIQAFLALSVLFLLKDAKVSASQSPSLVMAIGELRSAGLARPLAHVCSTNLLIVMAFACFQQFFPTYLVSHFAFSERNISYTYTYLSFVWILAQQCVVTPLSKRWETQKGFACYCLAFACVLTAFSLAGNSPWAVLALVPFVAVTAAGALTHAVVMVSETVADSHQGAALGINRAMHGLGRGLPSVLAGYLAGINCDFPLLAAAVLCGGAAYRYRLALSSQPTIALQRQN